MNDFSESKFAWKGPFDKAGARMAPSTRQTDLLLPETPTPIELEIPISQLPFAGPLFGDEMVAVVQNGITCRSTTSLIGRQGEAPVFIFKTATLVYPVTIGQTIFSLSAPDHFGNMFALSEQNALEVTIGGIRFTEDDGTGTFGQYVVDFAANTVTLITPFGTDPVVIVGDRDLAIFDIFQRGNQTVTVVPGGIVTERLTIDSLNVIPDLSVKPDGQMTVLYVAGLAYFAQSGDFTVDHKTLTWTNGVVNITPGATVVACYTVGAPSPPPLVPPLPLSDAGLLQGAIWNNGGFVCVVP